jgi:tetratricopeptide (TPR) repeat protein
MDNDYRLGLNQFIAGRFEDARETITTLAAQPACDLQTLKMLACTCAYLYQYRDALQVYDRLQERGHDCAECASNRTILYKGVGQKSDALIAANRALELDSRNSRAWALKALVLIDIHDLNRFDPVKVPLKDSGAVADIGEAVACLTRAMELDSNLWSLLSHKGRLFYSLWRTNNDMPDYAHARDAFLMHLERNPKVRDAWYHLGLLASEAEPKDLRGAKEAFLKVTELDRDDLEAHIELARVHLALDERDACIEAIRIARRLYERAEDAEEMTTFAGGKSWPGLWPNPGYTTTA